MIVVTLTRRDDKDEKLVFNTWGELTHWFVTLVRPEDFARITIAIKRST